MTVNGKISSLHFFRVGLTLRLGYSHVLTRKKIILNRIRSLIYFIQNMLPMAKNRYRLRDALKESILIQALCHVLVVYNLTIHFIDQNHYHMSP